MKAPIVLHVEDDESLVFLFQRLMARQGFNYHRVANVREAMAFVSNAAPFEDTVRYPQPSAVITDLGLAGGGSAVEFIQWLRSQPQHEHLPVVVLTGGGDPSGEQRAVQAGADACVLKGSNVQELLRQLRSVFAAHGVV